MEILLSHNNADCDGFGSLVAARRLYPGARIVLGRQVAPRVRDVLALHRDELAPLYEQQVDMAAVSRAVFVDVRRAGRLRDFGVLIDRAMARDPSLDVHVYDHHGPSDDDLPASLAVVEPVGATSTIFAERFEREGIEPTITEATLLALGIHTDTGSLTYETSTPRDARALGWLVERGASLEMLERYLRLGFDDGQRDALTRLLGSITLFPVGGFDVAIGGVSLERPVNGLALVVTQALRLTGHPALFAVFHIGGRKVQIVARARAPEVDVGAALRELGGGGHVAAAAANLRSDDPWVVVRRLQAALELHPPRARQVREVMDPNVHTLEADTPLVEAAALLEQWGVSGAPVMRDGRLCGMFDRGFLEAARRDGRMHLKVNAAMAHDVPTIAASAPVERALEEIVRLDISRLVVEESGAPVGLIGREELIRVMYRRPASHVWAG